jgi:uncharacterized membrane protein
MKTKIKDILHDVFEAGILVKFIDGVIQIIGAIFLFFIGPKMINTLLLKLFAEELVENPNNFIINHLLSFSAGISQGAQIIFAIYLFANGLVKVGLVLAIWKHKPWAYPLCGVVLSLFVLYEFYLFVHTLSFFLFSLMIIDIIILALLRFDYLRLKRSIKNKGLKK